MGVPDVVAGPAEILGVLARPAAELLQRIGDVLVVLGEVGMQHHPLVAREFGRVAHQTGRDRERRTGRQPDPHHRPVGRIVEGVDHPDEVAQDVWLGLDEAIRRQPAGALADAHRPAGRVEADAVVAAAAMVSSSRTPFGKT